MICGLERNEFLACYKLYKEAAKLIGIHNITTSSPKYLYALERCFEDRTIQKAYLSGSFRKIGNAFLFNDGDNDLYEILSSIENPKVLTEKYLRMLEIVYNKHLGQVDKGGKIYILHLVTVSMDSELKTEDERLLGLAHDLLKDTDITEKDLVENGFGCLLPSLRCITKNEGEKYDQYIDRICTDKMALIVKIADIKHNSCLSRIKNPTRADVKRKEKYQKYLQILRKVLLEWEE